MSRNQPIAAFVLALMLLSQSGCCCCVTIPTGPQPGDGGENGFGEFVPPEEFSEEDENSLEAPADAQENSDEPAGEAAVRRNRRGFSLSRLLRPGERSLRGLSHV